MSLADLTLPGMEKYGGIDLKRNFKRYMSNAFGVSVGIHLLLLLLYWVSTMFGEDEKKIPRVRVRNVAELAPPPSTSEPMEALPMEMAPPEAAIAKPTFGIPVPVPEALAPTPVMPDMAQMQPQGVPEGTGNVTNVLEGQGQAITVAPAKVEEDIPDKGDFVSVESEPEPVVNIQSLVVYPEVAKRAGLEGKVTVSALIGKDGRVEKVEVEKSDFAVFEQPAMDAIKKARFTPAKQNGQPVRVWYTLPIIFKLNSGR